MSTTFATIDTTKPAVPFSRLFKVELRKMFDTRAGFWLMISTGILIALTLLITLLVVNPRTRSNISRVPDWGKFAHRRPIVNFCPV